jgi:hypothetical protein
LCEPVKILSYKSTYSIVEKGSFLGEDDVVCESVVLLKREPEGIVCVDLPDITRQLLPYVVYRRFYSVLLIMLDVAGQSFETRTDIPSEALSNNPHQRMANHRFMRTHDLGLSTS